MRKKKESSIYQGLEYVKNKKCLGFVSAGNTAALMILSRLLIGTIEGIERGTIGGAVFGYSPEMILLDLG